MARNTFEQVTEIQDDALNLILRQTGQGRVGTVRIPAGASNQLPGGTDSGELPAVDAFRSAIQLANEMKLPVVVIDPDGCWHPEWGDLERYEDDETNDA